MPGRGSLLRPALRAELRVRLHFGAAILAEFFGLDGRPTFGAELGVLLQGRVAFGTGGAHPRPPGFVLQHFPIFLRHLGMRPDLLGGAAGLRGGHLHAHVRRAILAKAARLIPATLPTDPRRAARTLDKVWLDLLDGLHEGLVPGLLPTGGPGALAQVRGPAEHASEQTGSRVQRPRDVPQRPGLELGLVAVSAPVALKFELKTAVRGMVGVITGEFDRVHVCVPRPYCGVSPSAAGNVMLQLRDHELLIVHHLLQRVADRNDADEFPFFIDGQVADVFVDHNGDAFVQRLAALHVKDFGGHDLGHLRLAGGASLQVQPADAVALGQDAGHFAIVDDQYRAGVLLGHQFEGFKHRRVGTDRPDFVALLADHLSDCDHTSLLW